jgi:hypothetical protein
MLAVCGCLWLFEMATKYIFVYIGIGKVCGTLKWPNKND